MSEASDVTARDRQAAEVLPAEVVHCDRCGAVLATTPRGRLVCCPCVPAAPPRPSTPAFGAPGRRQDPGDDEDWWNR